MKNIIKPVAYTPIGKSWGEDYGIFGSCSCTGLFSWSPDWSPLDTCPYCGELEASVPSTHRYTNTMNNKSYCTTCNIIFDSAGCEHAHYGCSSSCYNVHLIGKWLHVPSGIIYTGMPQFNNIDEWYTDMDKVVILEWTCPNNGIRCDDDAPECTLLKNKT